jgi:hypothetical protein
MPISLDEFSNPKWIRYQERYPMSYVKQDRFNEINPMHFAGRYPGSVGREGGWKEAGYNPHHQSTRIEHFNIRSDDITLLPY